MSLDVAAAASEFTRACGWPATARTMPPTDLPERHATTLQVAARRHGLDIIIDPPSSTPTPQGATP
jgi:hypothetical protein